MNSNVHDSMEAASPYAHLTAKSELLTFIPTPAAAFVTHQEYFEFVKQYHENIKMPSASPQQVEPEHALTREEEIMSIWRCLPPYFQFQVQMNAEGFLESMRLLRGIEEARMSIQTKADHHMKILQTYLCLSRHGPITSREMAEKELMEMEEIWRQHDDELMSWDELEHELDMTEASDACSKT